MADDALLTVDDFVPRIGEVFEVAIEGREAYRLELTEAQGTSGESDARQPFSVIFRAVEDLVLAQGIYHLESAGGSLDLFLVPLGPERGGQALLYEAAFS